MKNLFQVTIFAVLLAGCASTGPTVTSNANPGTDFSAIQTFGFMAPLGTDRPGGVRTPLSNMLAASVIEALEARGLRQASNPDVLVNFFVNTEQRLDVRQVPTATSFHGYRRGRYSTWRGYETRVREYTRGTLAIDLVDPGQSLLVWEAHAQGRLSRGSTEVTREQIDNVVGALFDELPR